MANALTGIRIICGLLILVFPAFSRWFYLCYLIGGFTDAVDGTVARKLGKESAFGAKFDTIADFIFILTVLIKIIGELYLPLWLYVWIIVIAVIKFGNVTLGYKKYHSFVAVHSILNKVCGGIVFLVPLYIGASFPWQFRKAMLIITCGIASVAAIDELLKIKNGEIE